jgi:hypothetical protein
VVDILVQEILQQLLHLKETTVVVLEVTRLVVLEVEVLVVLVQVLLVVLLQLTPYKQVQI